MNYPMPQNINGNVFDEESPGCHCDNSSFPGDLTRLGLVINIWIFNDLFFMSVSSSNCRLFCVSVYACVCAENVG